MQQVLTVGFEEEFLLVDADGYPLPQFDAVFDWLANNVDAAISARFKPELQPVQIEAVSEVRFPSYRGGLTIEEGPDGTEETQVRSRVP
jgi:hypothetical protein